MTTDQAFDILERLITVGVFEFSTQFIENARTALNMLRAEIEQLNRRNEAQVSNVTTARHEMDMWYQRANAQLEIMRAAVAIVAKPYQMYESRGYSGAYLISKKEFEELQHAVESYKKLTEQEQSEASCTNG